MIITIDGPAGSGKSTLARSIAQQMNLFYIASGSLYRALSFILIKYYNYTIDTINQPHLSDIQDALDSQHFKYIYHNAFGQIFFDGIEITAYLNDESISQAASLMATSILAQNALNQFQRSLADNHDVIIDGRNCGSEIFPGAEIKIYLTASVRVRAQRVLERDKKRENESNINQMINIINERDKRDIERKVGPLVIPTGAIIVDNSDLSIDQSIACLREIIESYIKKRKIFRPSFLQF